MTGDITELFEVEQGQVEYLICKSCGSAYFRIEAIVLRAEDRHVTGYSGVPCCIRCGRLSVDSHAPEGVAMPCGNCRIPLTLPEDAEHICGAAQ